MAAQISVHVWARVLVTPMGKYMVAPQARLTAAQSKALTRFVKAQYRSLPAGIDFPITSCATAACMEIQALGPSFEGIFVVSPTPHSKNPTWWLIRLSGNHLEDLTPRVKADPFTTHIPFGYISVLTATHHGLRDLANTYTQGAFEQSMTYLEFDGVRYRIVGSKLFKSCDQTPGHSDTNDDRWCFSDGTIVGNRQ